MFEWALDKEIPILSVHDSFAVQAKYANETWDMMNEAWKQVVLSHSQSLR
jgi:hypothetical protein